MSDRFTIQFYGGFAVRTPDGRDVTPKGSKARGLLALIAEAEDMRRGRRWLESMLWSDRSPGQASGSLRQTLTEIRAALGEDADLFAADRLEVWLDPARVATDLGGETAPRQDGRQLLEGLTIRDPAFNGWLDALRARHAARPAAPSPIAGREGLKIRCVMSETGSPAERIAGNIVADQVAKNLEERLSALRFAGAEGAGQVTPDLEIRCEVAEQGGRGVVFLRIEYAQDGRTLFSAHRDVEGGAADAISAQTITGLVHSAAAKLTHRLPAILDLARPEAAALGYMSLGLRKLSRFEPDRLNEAEGFFGQAYEAEKNGVYLAWKAFARMAQLVEGAEGNPDARLEEVHQLTADSLQQSGDNGLAVALVALTRIMLEDDLTGPAELARLATAWNASSLFAQQTLAVAHSAVGDTAKAYELSRACRHADPEDELGHLWELYHALVCISSGRLEEARAASRRAADAAPGFVAPRRQLVALCAHAGDMAGARSYLGELMRLEQDFSLDRYLNDPDYPVLTLRNAGLIDPLKRGPLDG